MGKYSTPFKNLGICYIESKEGVDYMCNNTDGKCIAEILTVICILQQNANCVDNCCLDTCKY